MLSTGEVWRTTTGGVSFNEIVEDMWRDSNLQYPKTTRFLRHSLSNVTLFKCPGLLQLMTTALSSSHYNRTTWENVSGVLPS